MHTVEQLNLQRQLEIVQAQQQQILQQQQQLNQKSNALNQQQAQNSFNFQNLNLNQNQPNSRNNYHHRRSSSNQYQYQNQNQNQSQMDKDNSSLKTHRRSQSSITSVGSIPFSKTDPRPQALGHTRRHSLGLAEAKKAAAEAHAQRQTNSPSKLSIASNSSQSTDIDSPTTINENSVNPPVFKFPGSPKLEPPIDYDYTLASKHSRNRSNISDKSPQGNFQFPPKESNSNTLQPPQPAFADRQSVNHRSTGSDMSLNWRKQQTLSPPQNPNTNFESPNFIPGHRSRNSYGGSISSISQFNQSGNGQRKSLFAPYLPQNSLPELINEGKLVTGTLRVNKKNRSDAYVSTDGLLDADIFICGSKDRNRALEGDLVAVELLVVDEVWSSKREKEEKKRRKDTKLNSDLNDDVHNDASTSSALNDQTKSLTSNLKSGSLNRKNSLKQRPIQKKNDDVEVEGQSLLLVEEEEINDDAKPLYAGHVVAVIDRIPGQLFSGTLGLLRPSQAAKKDKKDKDSSNNKNNEDRPKPKIVWFKPIDKKVPLIAIPTEQAPKDFVENHEKYANQTFIASIKRWPITSLHPFGTLVSRLGPTEDSEVEVESILRDNNFMCDEYIDGEEKYMLDFPTCDYILSKSQRKQYSDDYIIAFSQNGSFSDHAFHVKSVENNKIELGVHIVDVSEFVSNNSNLDKRARKRSHGVFLPQKSVNLFPDNINKLISFQEGVKSPALSVIFEIDSLTFNIENVWMGETVIKPSKKLTYDELDSILEEKSKPDSAISGYIPSLALIASRLKKKRLSNPNLNTKNILPLLDHLDDERVKLTLNIYDNIQSNFIIDELFHNVNAAVAQKIHSALGDRAFLRKYPIPTLNKFEYYQSKIAQIGVELDTTNAATFQNSILKIDDPIKREAVETILIKCMSRGKYVIAGKTDQELGHYIFNLPTYTHFNAPLRRYADIIVHRQLKHIINNTIDQYSEDMDSLKVVSDYCNFKKDCANATQEQAIHLLLCQTINDMSLKTGQVLCTGIVIQVYESAFDVYLPEFGIEKRVHGDQLPLSKAEFDNTNKILKLFWQPNIDSSTYVPADENDSLSYRASIKNKFRGSAVDVAKNQDTESTKQSGLLSDEMFDKLRKMNLEPPKIAVKLPEDGEKLLDPYFKDLNTEIDGTNYMQDIKLLSKVPVILRSEVGMALPCLTVRVLNPFCNIDNQSK